MTASLVPAVIETAIKPKPTKDEILTALATLYIEQIKKENEERSIKHEAVKKKIERLLVALARKSQSLMEPDVTWYDYESVPKAYVNFTFREDVLSPEIKGLMETYKNTARLCVPCMTEARKQVRAAMGELVSKGDRVAALLNDPKSREALEKALDVMSV